MIRRSATDHLSRPIRLGPRYAALAVGYVCIAMAGLAIGSVPLPIGQVVAGLLGKEVNEITQVILFDVRLTRTITALLVGAALGVTGLMMQTLFRNPLADPYVLGVSSGASLGVALVVLLAGTSAYGTSFTAGLGMGGDFAAIIAASVGSALTMLVVVLIGRFVRSSNTLLLLGVMLGYLVSSLVTILLANAQPESIAQFTRWGFGSYQGVTWSNLSVLAPVLCVMLLASWPLVKGLNALLLGERYAETMGMHIKLMRAGIVLVSAVLAGSATAFCGPISFLGIAMPHLTRSIFGTSNHRILLPGVLLVGGMVALTAEILAQLPGNGVLPLNAVNAAIGAPIVIYILIRRSKEMSL